MSGAGPVFIPERVYQLDAGGIDQDNLLFRGNLPLVDTHGVYSFGYQALQAQFKKMLGNPAFSLNAYHLIVVMLLDDADEYPAFAAEVGRFNDASGTPLDALALSYERTYPGYRIPGWNPTTLYGRTLTDEDGQKHPGSLVWWPIEACGGSPCTRRFLGPGNTQSYNFMGLIDFVHTTLQGAPISGKPVLIYFHGLSGTDRTGATAVGYAMNYLGLTFNEAEVQAKNSATPSPSPAYRALACAYCHQIVVSNAAAACSGCSADYVQSE